MLPQKKFSTFSEQVEWLQDEKHLIISDRQYAEDVLKHIGYFPLMGGYKHLFRIPLTKKYKDGTSFDEIVSLYEFDAELRELFFKYLLQIERHLRSLMSYYFSEQYGESQSAWECKIVCVKSNCADLFYAPYWGKQLKGWISNGKT